MFNVPIPGGSTGHAVGGAIIGIVLGPWAAVIAISVALVLQALMFGDGGITAIAANSRLVIFDIVFEPVLPRTRLISGAERKTPPAIKILIIMVQEIM